MAKSKEKKKHPKAPEGVATVDAIKKTINERKEKLAKRKEGATKEGKLNKYDGKYRVALKRVKRAQRKLLSEAYRLHGHSKATPVAAPAEAEKKA